MNPSEQFIPQWAADALTKPPPVNADELMMLREFYDQWVVYHTLPNDGRMKDRQRLAGKKLIAMHQELESLHANRQ